MSRTAREEINKRPRLTTDDQLRILRDQLTRAKIFMDVYWTYREQHSRRTFIDAMNEHPRFFQFDEHAHLTAFIVHLNTIADNTNDAIKLEKLVDDECWPSEVAASIRATFEQASTVSKKLKLLRSSAFAHRSNKVDYDEAFSLAELTYGELNWLVERYKELLDLMLRERNLEPVDFDSSPKEHLELMLERLRP